jgi:hypothetical protein
MRFAAFVSAAVLSVAQLPQDAVDFFHDAATALSSGEASEFLDHFDSAMPGYATLRGEIEELKSRAEVATAINFVSDSGGDQRRTLELDWMLEITDRPTRRQIVKCTIERQKKGWKIVALEPIDFFKY